MLQFSLDLKKNSLSVRFRVNAARKAIFHVHDAFVHTGKWEKNPNNNSCSEL